MTARPVIDDHAGRRRLVLGLFLLGMAVLVGRAVELQVFEHDFLRRMGDARQTRTIAIPAHRGRILDRNGELLAVSTPVDSIWVNPQLFPATPDNLAALGQALGIATARLRQRLARHADKEFLYLRRHLNPDVARQVLALGLPGVNAQREYRRYYPMGEVFSHVVGFNDIDDHGQAGLEKAFDDWLTGRPGLKRVLRDRRGHIIDDLALLRPAQPGKDLRLSLDARIQYVAYRELSRAVRRHRAKSGSIVVLDPRSGEILAMANQPGFNPNNRRELGDPARYRNRAVTDLFEPGSTAKPFTIAAALESGRFRPDSMVDTAPGHYRVSGFPIRDKHNLGKIDLATIIAKSSNVGASKLAMSIEPEQLWSVFHRVGFGQNTGSGFPGEAGGVLRDYTRWYPLDRATLSFGYGFAVTALQLASAYGVLADDGRYRPPTFIKGQGSNAVEQVLRPRTARLVRRMMEGVVSPQGTGYRAAVPGYAVAGKTGTAKVAVRGGYARDRYIAAFAGMAPADAPRLVVVVVIHEPGAGQFYGGQVAAPVFSRVMAEALNILNVPPDDLDSVPAAGSARGDPV